MIKYTLYRIEDNETTTAVGEHDSIGEGLMAAGRIVEGVDFNYAYTLISSSGARVATFCEGRIGYREWAIRSGRIESEYIHSLDDRYEHDLDELGLNF